MTSEGRNASLGLAELRTLADHHFVCAAKGEPFTLAEWDHEVARLGAALADATARREQARAAGYCLPARLDLQPNPSDGRTPVADWKRSA